MTNLNNQREVENIRRAYEEKKVNKTEELKSLDRKVRRPAEIFAYSFGIVSALVFGTGMCLAMKVIGASLSPVIGIGVGVVGMGLCGLNYLIYSAVIKRRKAKYAKQILALCDEALGETTNF